MEKGKHNKRRWWPLAVGGVLLVSLAIYLGAGWYISSEMLAVNSQRVAYDHKVVAVDGNNYNIAGGAYDVDGVMGGIRSDGTYIGLFSKPSNLNTEAKTSVRALQDGHGESPRVNEQLSLQGNIWISNPKEALGLEYSEVRYPSPLGDMNAWVVPAKDSKIWTIAVHGVGAPLSELLRFIKPVHDAGNTVLAINYRNDVGNPASPDGLNHLSDTEWQDLQAAIRYARQQGAEAINVYGVSLGGSIVENYLRRAPAEETAGIGKVVLDSPVLDWKQLTMHRIKAKGYPGFLAQAGMTVARWRAGIDFNKLSTAPGSIRHKTLIIHNSDDTNVPIGPAIKVAEAQPDLITLHDFKHGGHTRAWNHDVQRYEQLVTDFLR